ncbi:unnamed protein product [Rotaria sordida]|uniref:Uncharacterized protein n=1 Tax=Rotaria sordida TaxID=392033 RepID=A0A819GFK6_9BILA|nr:unnamed protein product [Rotaria sordida]
MFQHITLYHQNEPNFNITCNLHNRCGVLYQTYSAYKAHVYRQHANELHLKNKPNNNSNVTLIDSQQEESLNNLDIGLGTINNADDTFDLLNDDIEAILVNDDCEMNVCNPASLFDSIHNDESISESFLIMKRSYMLFLLELRQEYLLPQGVTNIISTYIVTLIHHLDILLDKKAFLPSTDIYSYSTSSLPKQNQKIIEIYQLHETLNNLFDLLPSFIVYKVLREILNLTLSYPFRKKWLHVLGELCDTFHETMPSHFPDKITPKEHFIREYKYTINDFGPAVRQWCFRYEANHSYVKKITVRTNNFKNIPKMFVTRYHLKQCLTFGHLSRLQSTQYPVGIKKVRSTCFDLPMKDILLKHFDHIDFDKDLYQCNTLIYDNVEYRRCGVYVIDLKPSHEQPIFAQITMIIKKNEKWWLLVDNLHTIGYDGKLSAWQIQSLKHDVDGPMLKMMNNVERISQLIPKFKQQLIFLEEREKLFRRIDDGSISSDDSFSNTSTISKTPNFTLPNAQTSPAVSVNSRSPSSTYLSSINLSSTMSMDYSPTDQAVTDAGVPSSFLDVYEVPILPKALLKDIEAGNLKTFGSHCQGRQILIDAVVHDLIENYNLLPKLNDQHKTIVILPKTQYNVVGSALVRCLKLPSTPENLAIWKDALQTKLKLTRADHPNNSLVQEFRLKYSKLGSGCPVKQKIGEIAERDRHKQMVIMPYNNEISDDIQSKVKQLQNFSQLDVNTQLRLWKETFVFRRQVVQDQSTSDIMKNFPAYSLRRNKLVETPAFIADSPPIRLIKIFCRKFGETVQHIFCEKEPQTPYPTLVSIDDVIHIYVDFHPILSTSSPDDALGLLIGMYFIFELFFDKKSRTIRFLYCVLHCDKQFLSNSIRVLIKEKNIDIHRERLQPTSISFSSISNNTTTLISESRNQLQIVTNLLDHSTGERNSSIINQTTEPTTSTHGSHSNVDMASNTNQFNNNNENVLPSDCSSQPQTRKKRKRKHSLNEEEQDDTLMNNAPQDNIEFSQSRLPLTIMTNSAVALRQTKRKRRI